MKTTSAVTDEITVHFGFWNMAGGVFPITMSRMAPPPTDVTIPRISIPKRSISFLMASMLPEIANAMEPMISNTDIKFVTLISSPLRFLRLAPICAVHLTYHTYDLIVYYKIQFIYIRIKYSLFIFR